MISALFGLVGCKKVEQERPGADLASNYVGTWEAREISFGEDPIDLSDVTFKLVFDEDGTGALAADDGSQDITWEVRSSLDPVVWVSIKEPFEVDGISCEIKALQLTKGLTENSLSFNESWQSTVEMDGYTMDAMFHMQGAFSKVS